MRFKRILKIVAIFTGLLLLLSGLFVGSVFLGVFGPLPNKEDLIGITNEEASLVFSNDGTIIGKIFAENRTNIRWNAIPGNLVNALVATEDRRFYEHKGLDSRSYLRVFFKTILLGEKSAGGGSTITQQLVKNLYGRQNHSFLSLPVSKTREAIIARRMEEVLSKHDILTLYFNSVPFGEEVYGVEAAAKRYFDKKAKDLNIQESAVLVGMLKANTYYNPRLHPDHAVKRRNQVLMLMAGAGFITATQADSLKKLPLHLKYTNFQLESPAGYFVYQVKKRAAEILEQLPGSSGKSYDLSKDGLKIYTTLDFTLQQIANRAARQQLAKMQPLLDKTLARSNRRKKWETGLVKTRSLPDGRQQKKEREILTPDGLKREELSLTDSLWHYYKMLNAAVLAIDPASGAVLTWVGGNNYRYLPYDLILAKRQIASTVKPFIYAAALEEGYTPCDYFDNNLKVYSDYPDWKPENYDKSHSDKMMVAMWYALSHSLNLPTVDLYFNVGHEKVSGMLRRFGLDAPFSETPALALGALDASLYDLVKAYGVFAGGGLLTGDLIMIEKITDADGNIIYKNEGVKKSRIINKEITEQITAILQIAINEGTGVKMRKYYGIRSPLAGKTGTAQNYSDAWFIAYTPHLVIGTWAGARSPQVHFSNGLGSGSSLALPVTGMIISAIEKQASMKKAYLTAFEVADSSSVAIDCDPFREKGLSGVMHRLTKKEQKAKEPRQKEHSRFRKFFDNLFKRKKKK